MCHLPSAICHLGAGGGVKTSVTLLVQVSQTSASDGADHKRCAPRFSSSRNRARRSATEATKQSPVSALAPRPLPLLARPSLHVPLPSPPRPHHSSSLATSTRGPSQAAAWV